MDDDSASRHVEARVHGDEVLLTGNPPVQRDLLADAVVDGEALIGHQICSQCQVVLLQMHPYGVGFLLWL